MDEEPNIFNKFVFLMDKNIHGVQIGVYSIAFVGLAVAVRSVRPFSKFKRPSDIPNGFVSSRMKLKGTVGRIEPNGPLLMVEHKPLISLFQSKSNSLPVKVSGVNVSGHGISWLQSVVSGNEITFIPVLKQKDCVHCEVMLAQNTRDKTMRIVNIGPALVSIGFGTISAIDQSLLRNQQYLRYYQHLKAAELAAVRKKLGVWYYVKPINEISNKILNNIMLLFKRKSKVIKLATA